MEPGAKRRTVVGTGEIEVDDWPWAVAEWREVKRNTYKVSSLSRTG